MAPWIQVWGEGSQGADARYGGLMKVDISIHCGTCFGSIREGESFIHSNRPYMRMEFIPIDKNCKRGTDGSTRDLGGYNAVRLDDGRPGSFQDDTRVGRKDLMVVAAS